ncbi:hypothetical protein HDU87_003931 [Geranomyces variabilis]|uniref:P-type Cu(+) transporter n=1 Tax=Geranomyces variabilis TaxID=109894 RepID=A0AAD5TQQ2_9FUNG|nr:hypothetical protein HDU87_003931 [Geranomyces variabilis]
MSSPHLPPCTCELCPSPSPSSSETTLCCAGICDCRATELKEVVCKALPQKSEVLNLDIEGMTCASCTTAIERALAQDAGVIRAHVNLITANATITYNPALTTPSALAALIDEMGYATSLQQPAFVATKKGDSQLNALQNGVFLAFLLAVPTVVISMLIMMALPENNSVRMAFETRVCAGLTVAGLCEAILATPMQFGLGAKFYRGAWNSLRHAGSANMDVLIALGTSVAYFYSLATLIADIARKSADPSDLYFETAVLLIFFVLLGKYLEAYARGRTSDAITQLLALTPPTAELVTVSPTYQILSQVSVPTTSLAPDDIIFVPPFSALPTDGVLLHPTAYIDESLLTGEPTPVCKNIGDPVLGGTQNTSSAIFIRATEVGERTAVARIAQMVSDAQGTKAEIQVLVDTVSRRFVPAVLAASLVTFVIWVSVVYATEVRADQDRFVFCLNFAVAVLVIACPCALGLATPTAVMVGTGMATRFGIVLAGGGAAIQEGAGVTVVAFDKTGTLTEGKPTVASATTIEQSDDKLSESDIWALLLSMESVSQHPLATAICAHALPLATKNPEFSHGPIEELPGRGLSGELTLSNGKTFTATIGSAAYVSATCSLRIDPTISVALAIHSPSTPARLLLTLTLADTPRASAAPTIADLRALGIDTWMLTGDTIAAAKAIGAAVGIPPECIRAGLLPGEKADAISQLQRAGAKVAMVGDGINDAVALAQANLSIALPGSSIAAQASSALLLTPDLSHVPVLLLLSRVTLRRIKLNLAWALVYNSAGIPIAAGILWPATGFALAPWVAGAAMAASGLCVVCSSLALRFWNPPRI